MAKAPTYEQMMSGQRAAGGLRAFLRALKAGETRRAPEGINRRTISSEMTRLGHELGTKYVSKTVAGVLWVTRVKPEDLK